MKVTLKLAVLSTALIGGIASAANVNTLPTAPTGSSLVLLMKNYTDNTFFAEEVTGTTVSQLNSASTLTNAGAGTYSLDGTGVAGSLTVPAGLNGYHSNNAATYLQANVGDNITWTIMGASQGNGSGATGAQSVVFTSSEDYLADNHYVPGGDPVTAVQGVTRLFVTELNGAVFTNGVSSTNGYDSTNVGGMDADITFIGNNAPNGAAIGTAQSLYQLTTSSDSLGANVYKSAATLSLGLNGTLTYNGDTTAPVPVPAAVWLLGSGIVSLVGVARRRKLEVQAA